MLAALRGGLRAVSAAGVGVAFAVDWATVTGRADKLIASRGPNQLDFIQLFIAITLLAAFTLAVEVADRTRAEHLAREAQAARDRAEREANGAAEEERRRIVRETHDIVASADWRRTSHPQQQHRPRPRLSRVHRDRRARRLS
jgi:signal transduction histidine kinase